MPWGEQGLEEDSSHSLALSPPLSHALRLSLKPINKSAHSSLASEHWNVAGLRRRGFGEFPWYLQAPGKFGESVPSHSRASGHVLCQPS